LGISFEGTLFLLEIKRFLASASLFLWLSSQVGAPPTQTLPTVRLDDNSDWRADTQGPAENEEHKPENRELPTANYEILGIDLGEDMFGRAAAKIGKATTIQRGDASTGREQACYVSPDPRYRVDLIFEPQKWDVPFILFEGGPDWKCANRCVVSKAISRDLATTSDLRLGMTPAQVIAIVGKPTKRHEGDFIYSFLVTKKTSPNDLKEARDGNPAMSEKDFLATSVTTTLEPGLWLSLWTPSLPTWPYLKSSPPESRECGRCLAVLVR